MNTETLKGMLVSGAISAAVAFGVVHAASVTPKAQAPAAEAQKATAAPRPPQEAAAADTSSIREAHSDGGHQDWMESQKAMP